MNIHVFTIVLDGMPFITHHLPIFHRLTVPWTWHIVEGVALPNHCTKWCRRIEPRLSKDGTSEYLDSLRSHPRVKLYRREQWDGKVEMVNEPLKTIQEPCLLMEIDADEIWTAHQIMILRQMFLGQPNKNCADFWCRYFVGPNLILQRIPGTWANNPNQEWKRAWRFAPGMRFERHEPPMMMGQPRVAFTHAETERNGLVFDHYAYTIEAQVRFKEQYYGYSGAVEQWRRLQVNTQWPVKVRDYFGWVNDDATATQFLT